VYEPRFISNKFTLPISYRQCYTLHTSRTEMYLRQWLCSKARGILDFRICVQQTSFLS